MAFNNAKKVYQALIHEINSSGKAVQERVLKSKQQNHVFFEGLSEKVLNLSSADYFGYASHAKSIDFAVKTLEKYGFGLSSGRIICGTLDIHKELEEKLAEFYNTSDTLLYTSCFDANSGVFEALLTKDDAIFLDSLSTPSLFVGSSLSQAETIVFSHSNMQDLEEKLKSHSKKRIKVIASEGVFSLTGELVKLNEICELSDKYNALVIVDDSHGTGCIGKNGRGIFDHFGRMDKIDLVNSSFNKAFGGSCGGFSTGKKDLVEVLRQKSRPYIFSNALAPVFTGTTLGIIEDFVENREILLQKLGNNRKFTRQTLDRNGFQVVSDENSNIITVLLEKNGVAQRFVEKLFEERVLAHVVQFEYKGTLREGIRIFINSQLNNDDLSLLIEGFINTRKKLEN